MIYLTIDSKSSSNKKKRIKTAEEEADELCPICDDVCTCSSSTSSAPMPSSGHSSSIKSAYGRGHNQNTQQPPRKRTFSIPPPVTRKSGSYIWDFNIKGQLIPLEDLGETEEYDSSDYSSTDAECSDLVSASEMSGDGLSDVLSSNEDNEYEVNNFEEIGEIEFMRNEEINIASNCIPINAFDCREDSSRIAAITPQILAAISTATKSFKMPNQTISVLMVSTEDEGDSSEYVSVIESFSEEMEDCEEEDDVLVFEGIDQIEISSSDNEDDREPSIYNDRWKRVPISAFYRRTHAVRRRLNPGYNVSNGLRSTSVDPTFIVTLTTPEIGEGDSMLPIMADEDEDVPIDAEWFPIENPAISIL